MTDELLRWRVEFPALERSVYMVSHSLGAMPRRAYDHLKAYADLWVNKGINAWEDWLPEVDRAAERVGRIIGAPKGSMVMATNVSQIQALVASCLDYTRERNKVVFTALNFPTVSYVWHEERRRGAEIVVVGGGDGVHAPMEALLEAIDERTLIVPISHVLFRSSAIKDVAAVVARAKQVGAMVLLDCYQSTGTVPFDVTALDVDFACGGSVKYVCGGPGAAWLYVRQDLIEKFAPRVTGWFGNEAPFAFTMPDQTYADTIWRYMGGTPAIAALYQSRAGQKIIAEIGARKIRDKSLVMTQKCIDWVDELGMKLNSPRAADQRGGSVVFDFVGSGDVCRELNRRKLFCDHRPGVGIRIAPHFYTKSSELDAFFTELKKIRGAASA